MSDSEVVRIVAAPVVQAIPGLIDALRSELHRVLDGGLNPIKLLVRGEWLPAILDDAARQGVLEDDTSPSEILGLPVMLGNELVSADEGARIVCEGD